MEGSKTCHFIKCVHKPYCHLDGAEWGSLCIVIRRDPTILGLTDASPRTLRSAIIFLRAELKHIKCKKAEWKTAYEIYQEEKYHG